MRFDPDASTVEGTSEYFRNRAIQMLADNFTWTGEVTPLSHEGNIWGTKTTFLFEDEEYTSIYVLKGYRGKGYLSWYAPRVRCFVTTPDCGILNYFRNKGLPVKLVGKRQEWDEYKAIQQWYGDKRAKRSGLHLMNHIDEGVAVLHWMGFSEDAQKAFMLHPLFQEDEALKRNLKNYRSFDWRVVLLAMEYRNIANSFLSPMEGHKGYQHASAIKLSPLPLVNQMLIADKIQNYKDFIAHHKGKHSRSDWLNWYFRQWLRRLQDVRVFDPQLFMDRLEMPKTKILEAENGRASTGNQGAAFNECKGYPEARG